MKNKKLIWKSNGMENEYFQSHIKSYINMLQEQLLVIDEYNLKLENQEMKFDYLIEGTRIQHISLENKGNIWLKVKLFLENDPDVKYNLSTLYCNVNDDFPVTVEFNYGADKESVCHDQLFLQEVITDNLTDSLNILYKNMKRDYDTPYYLKDSNITENQEKKEEFIQGRLNRLWSYQEYEILMSIMHEYRNEIENLNDEDVKKITRKYAFNLKKDHTELEDRTEQAIYERLSYFDDLLAGVFDLNEYAIKDRSYFGEIPRRNPESNPARIWRNKRNYLY